MDQGVKASIDARKQSFEASYILTDEIKKEIDSLFKKIEEFGKTCKDSMDFENKFASSPLNNEYIAMFTKVGQSCKVKQLSGDDDEDLETESKGKRILKEMNSDAKYLADDLMRPARRQARMEMDSKLRSTPLGKIEQANNTFWLLKKFKKPKKVDTEIESNDEN